MNDKRCTLTLIRGIPGSGKTKFVSTAFKGIPYFENDMFFGHNFKYQYDRAKMPEAIDWCMSMVESCLKIGIDVCVSNTFTKKKYVDVYKRLAEKYNANFVVYKMMGDFMNVHDVPSDVLKNMKDNFEDYDHESYVYPNTEQSKDDPGYTPYSVTDKKVGDKVVVTKIYDTVSGKPEKCIATVTEIKVSTYGMLNLFYSEDDTGKAGLCYAGDCEKII